MSSVGRKVGSSVAESLNRSDLQIRDSGQNPFRRHAAQNQRRKVRQEGPQRAIRGASDRSCGLKQICARYSIKSAAFRVWLISAWVESGHYAADASRSRIP